MQSLRRFIPVVFLIGIWILFMPSTAAQTVMYKTETKTSMPMLGAMGNLFGNKPVESTTYVTDQYMRVEDDDNSATIYSVPQAKMIFLDRKNKTYYEIAFDDLTNMFSAMQEEAEQQLETQEAGDAEMPEIEFDLSVDDLGETRDIAGRNASRKLMRMDMKYTAEGTDSEGHTTTASGNFYTLSDMWVASGMDDHEVVKAFHQNFSEQMGASLTNNNQGMASAFQQAFQQDARLGPAMEKMREEMQELDGLALQSKMYFVLVPEGAELDVNAVINDEAKQEDRQAKRKRGLGRLARGALRQRGLNVGEEESQQPGEGDQQSVLMVTETQYTQFDVVPDDPARFTVPAGFEQVEKPAYFQEPEK